MKTGHVGLKVCRETACQDAEDHLGTKDSEVPQGGKGYQGCLAKGVCLETRTS